jgi:hypothetical protein
LVLVCRKTEIREIQGFDFFDELFGCLDLGGKDCNLIDETGPDSSQDAPRVFLSGKRRGRGVKERYSGQFQLVNKSGMESEIAAVPEGDERVAGGGLSHDFFGDREVAAESKVTVRAGTGAFRIFGLALGANHGGREFTTGLPSKWM